MGKRFGSTALGPPGFALDVPYHASQIIAGRRDHPAASPHLPGGRVFVGHEHRLLARAGIALAQFRTIFARSLDQFLARIVAKLGVGRSRCLRRDSCAAARSHPKTQSVLSRRESNPRANHRSERSAFISPGRARRSFRGQRGRLNMGFVGEAPQCYRRGAMPATIATRSPSPSSRPDDPFRPNGTVKTAASGCCGLSPLELGAVDPDAVQDHRDLTGNRDARLAVS